MRYHHIIVNALLGCALLLAQDSASGLIDRAAQTTDVAERIRLLSEAVRQEPDSARAAYLLGKAHDDARHYQLALDAYRRAAATSRDAAPRALSLYQQARMESALGHNPEACRLLRESIAARATTEAQDLLARLSRPNGAMAAEAISRALAVTPEAMSEGQGATPAVDLAIEFEFGQDVMTPDGIAQAEELVSALNSPQFAGARFLVVGHTDRRGSEPANQALSERRAASVVSFLAARGIARTRLRAEGRGSREPRASGDTEENYRVNRRVEIRVVGR